MVQAHVDRFAGPDHTANEPNQPTISSNRSTGIAAQTNAKHGHHCRGVVSIRVRSLWPHAVRYFSLEVL
jgi:hypothetical protein